MLFRYNILASTSLKAKSLGAMGISPPFGVISVIQEKGRGQFEKSWISPRGNLYLTLSLDPHNLNPTLASRIPLIVGIWICDFILLKFGTRLTLKWPNDLLFAGRKICGILCESQIGNNFLSEIYVGIGFNLTTRPKDGTLEYDAISLGEICQAEIDVHNFGQELYNFIQQRWPQKPWIEEDMLAEMLRFELFDLEKKSLWIHKLGHPEKLYLGLDKGSNLKLGDPFDDEKILYLNSARHDYIWQYLARDQGQKGLNTQSILVFDCGNSALKVAFFKDARHQQSPNFMMSCLHRDDLNTFYKKVMVEIKKLENLARPTMRAYGISVNDLAFAKALFEGQSFGITLTLLKKRCVRMGQTLYNFGELGVDRLALIEGILLKRPLGPFMVLSFGTALTLDIIDQKGQHLGGLITPGLTISLASLHNESGNLPKIAGLDALQALQNCFEFPLGKNTHEAMVFGALSSMVSLVKSYQARYEIESSSIFFCGGDSMDFSVLFGGVFCPDAVILGVREMALGGTIPV